MIAVRQLVGREGIQWWAVALALLAGAALVSVSPVAAQSPPGTPSSVTISRSHGTLTAAWPTVNNATAYHVTYSSDGGVSWRLAALRHAGTSITIDVKNSATYIVGVRAGNDYGWGGWRNSPPSGPYYPPTPPGKPSAVSLTRADGALTAAWPAVTRATKYHITYSADNGKNWSLAALNHAASSITVSGVENGATYIVGVRAGNQHGWSGWRNSPPASPFYPKPPPPAVPSNLKAYGGVGSVTLAWDDPEDSSIYYYEYQYRKDAEVGWGAWTATPKGSGSITSYTVTGLTNGTKYHFKLRAVSAGGASNPTSSVSATPGDGVTIPKPQPGTLPPDPPASVTLTRAAGTLTADWPDGERATSYHVTYSADNGASWSLAASKHTQSNITITGVSDSATYIVAVRGRNDSGYGPWRNSAPLGPLTLTASDITATTARLTIDGYTGDWYVKKTAPSPAGACSSLITGATHSLTNLSPGTTYTYKAYSYSGCTVQIASETFTTQVSVSNLGQSDNNKLSVGHSGGALQQRATAFTTGNSTGGYTLSSITVRFDSKSGSPGNIVVAVHAESGGNPAASATATLSGSNPNSAGNHTYTCSNNCDLSQNTTYFLVLSAPSASTNQHYEWRTTSSDNQSNTPSDAGWSIGNVVKSKSGGGNWGTHPFSLTGKFKVSAWPK